MKIKYVTTEEYLDIIYFYKILNDVLDNNKSITEEEISYFLKVRNNKADDTIIFKIKEKENKDK